ncbi:hypothetical protein PENSPDRAFT_649912 [Peniophora sp. CONT]|nr:hypothetical protein PENSPDRAFT_649912 [Peniophora sp. CONT]
MSLCCIVLCPFGIAVSLFTLFGTYVTWHLRLTAWESQADEQGLTNSGLALILSVFESQGDSVGHMTSVALNALDK